MTGVARRRLFLVGALVLAALLLVGMRGLPPLGEYRGVYGETLLEVAVPERRATDVVSAVNFDYRAVDTLGEELILFASVVGVAALLRLHADEREEPPTEEGDRAERRRAPPMSDAVRTLAVGLVPVTVVFGAYMCSHGVPAPGGGFQGGVILATAPLVVYLASDPRIFRRIAPEEPVEVAEAVGAAGYVAVGSLGLLFGRPFLTNVLPLGEPGTAVSGGIIFVLNLTVGLEVAAGFVLLLVAFLREALEVRIGGGP